MGEELMTNVETTLLPPLIERVTQLHDILARNTYIADVTKRLKNIIQDAQNPPMILFVGKERVGKTTLINALLGIEMLPTSHLNPTAVNTFIRYAKEPSLKVYFKDGMVASFDLEQLEMLSTSNQLSSQILREHLDYLELYLDHELLKKVTLVDSTALEIDSKHVAYLSDTIIQRVDEIFWVLRCGSTTSDAEVALLEKLNAKGIKPVLLANGIDYARASLIEFINAETEHIGHLVRTFLTVSAKDALESHFYNDSVKWYNSQFESLQFELDAIANNSEKKTSKILLQLIEWLHYFHKVLITIPQREPYASAIGSLEITDLINTHNLTKHQRDLAILAAYEEEFKQVSQAFSSVETLYQLLQTIEQYPFLQDEVIQHFFDTAVSYHGFVREYRSLHYEYISEQERLEEQHKKIYNKSIVKAIFKRHNQQDDYFQDRIEKLNEIQAKCVDVYNQIQSSEKQLFENLYFIENHLTELLKKRLELVHLKVMELETQRQRDKQIYNWNMTKMKELTCFIEAQSFIRDAIDPYLQQVALPLSEEAMTDLQEVISAICQFNFTTVHLSTTLRLSEREDFIIPDFEQKYPLHALALTEADIQAAIPDLPEILEIAFEEA